MQMPVCDTSIPERNHKTGACHSETVKMIFMASDHLSLVYIQVSTIACIPGIQKGEGMQLEVRKRSMAAEGLFSQPLRRSRTADVRTVKYDA